MRRHYDFYKLKQLKNSYPKLLRRSVRIRLDEDVIQTRGYIDVYSEDLIGSVNCFDKALDLQDDQEFWKQNGHKSTFQAQK